MASLSARQGGPRFNQCLGGHDLLTAVSEGRDWLTGVLEGHDLLTRALECCGGAVKGCVRLWSLLRAVKGSRGLSRAVEGHCGLFRTVEPCRTSELAVCEEPDGPR